MTTESTDAKLARMIEDARIASNDYKQLDAVRNWWKNYLSLLLLVQTMGEALEDTKIEARACTEFNSDPIVDYIISPAILSRDETIKELK